jgi:hypothetical protein
MDVFTDIPTDGDLKEIYTLTNDELGSLLPRVDTLLSWAKSLESHALGELNSGNKIKGYKLVMGRAGNRKWTNEKKAQDHLTVLGLNEDEIYSKKINTPAQMCRILKDKKIDVGKTENLWNSPEGKTTIAIESDKRVEVLPPSIMGFSDIET